MEQNSTLSVRNLASIALVGTVLACSGCCSPQTREFEVYVENTGGQGLEFVYQIDNEGWSRDGGGPVVVAAGKPALVELTFNCVEKTGAYSHVSLRVRTVERDEKGLHGLEPGQKPTHQDGKRDIRLSDARKQRFFLSRTR